MEVILTSTGPCLVEVGTRCHGGEATWATVAQECIGYTQIEATLNCYLRPDRFEALPSSPQTLLKQGAEVFLVSHQSGLFSFLFFFHSFFFFIVALLQEFSKILQD
jgi:hypothetical protein